MAEIDLYAKASPKWVNSASETVFGVDMYGARKVTMKDSDGNELFSDDNPANVWINDGPNCDAFMRLRTSNPVTLFDAVMQYNTQPLFWQTVTTGTGTATHVPNESTVNLAVATNGDWVIRQTKQYFRYQPGKSQMPLMSGVMGALQTSITQRIGYFDNKNGLFFEQNGTNLRVVRRTYVSGSIVDNAVNQDSWNIDTLDGNSTSGITIDTSKAQIFIMDFEWLGAGGVRFGFVVDNKLQYCHKFLNANNLSTVYMTTANLPLRYELRATGAITASATLKQICSTVISEGGVEKESGISHSVANGTSTISVTTRRPILSIRPKSAINSVENRSSVLPDSIELFATGATAYWELVLNGALTSANFSINPSENCNFEADVTASAISGGETIDSGYIASGNNIRSSVSSELVKKLSLSRDYAGTTADTLSLVVSSITSSATIVAGAITAKELY